MTAPPRNIIPFRMAGRPGPVALFRTGTRTIRPIEVILLSPVLLPLGFIVLMMLLGWFVLWLFTVGLLVAINLAADLALAMAGRAGVLRALDRRAISFQGR